MYRLTPLILLLGRTIGTGIEDVEHVVIFMQENRPFDHYYGTLKGVRGFNDPAAPLQPSGAPIWRQPLKATPKTCDSCVKNNMVWCYHDDVCYAHGDKEDTKAFSCPGTSRCASEHNCDCKSCSDNKCQPKIPNANTCEAKESCTVEGQYCPPQKVRNPDGTQPNGNCCVSKVWVPGTCGSAGIDVNATETAQLASGSDMYVLPFPLDFKTTSASCMSAPGMSYPQDIAMRNNGNNDAWCAARAPGFGMSFFNRSELPYYYALADAFTIGDQYFQSTFTATSPNREHLFSGSNGLSIGDGKFNLLDDSEPDGMEWETVGETLEKANVSWRLYQGKDNFDDNGFAWFMNYKNAKPGDPLHDKGMARLDDFVQTFADDVANDNLPQVSWLVGPAWLSEHATNHPADGEDLSARILQVLAKPENQRVYNKTVFILNYDEGGQFFDHHWTPTPPTKDSKGNFIDGKSTVTADGELLEQPYSGVPVGNPIGLGFRVPFFIISPWTRGNYVYSEVADHTSTIQFIEKRFGVHCPNISPWRRAITGDLTAAFNWSHHDASWPTEFPSTAGNTNASKQQCDGNPPPVIPTKQAMPVQETGTRLQRPLPYEFVITDNATVTSDASLDLTITMRNTGTAGAVFYVYDKLPANAAVAEVTGPRKYTVEAGKQLSDVWTVGTTTATGSAEYWYSLHGPNGFVRQFRGSLASAALGLSARITYDKAGQAVVLSAGANMATSAGAGAGAPAAELRMFTIHDNAYGSGHVATLAVDAPVPVAAATAAATATAAANTHRLSTAGTGNWYDVSVTHAASGFERRFMGRMETGQTTTSDPAMGAGPPARSGFGDEVHSHAPPLGGHPDLPRALTHLEPWSRSDQCASARSLYKDACWDTAWY